MASFQSDPVPVRRLSELLQEKQDSFRLDIYLQERGYSRKSENSDCSSNSSKNLKNLGSNCDSKKKRKRIQHCSKILRSVLNKFLSINDKGKQLNFHTRAYKDGTFSVSLMEKSSAQGEELDQYYSACSSSEFESCSEGDTEEKSPTSQQNHVSSSEETPQNLEQLNLYTKQASTEGKLQWGCMEEHKQNSPVSVLEQQLSNEELYIPLTSSFNLSKKVTEETIFSACLWELLLQSPNEKQGFSGIAELQELLGSGSSSSSSQYLKSKRVLQQKKQLLFDCVREAMDIHERKRKSFHKFLGAEELGRIICKKICLWGKESGDITNISHLINSYFSDSTEEWSDLEPHIKEIGMKIGNEILEDISNEIVTDMIAFTYIQ